MAQSIYVKGARLIDGTGRDPIESVSILIEGNHIAAVGRDVRQPSDASVIDAQGRTVLPGIIDCHVHGTYRARDIRRHLLNAPTYNVLRSISILEQTLACGVTTARDMGGADAGFRTAIDEGYIRGPRLLIAIAMISQTGGHGDAWLPSGLRLPKRSWLPDAVADGVDDLRRLARQLLMAGADFLKICATGGITSVTDSWDEQQFTTEEIEVVVNEAKMRRKTVAVHAEGLDGIRSALQADIHSLEHGWFIDEECVDIMIRKGVWWVPTLALVPLSLEHRLENAAWDKQQLAKEDAKERQIFDLMQQQIPLWKDAVRKGLKVAFGTDQSHRLMVGRNLAELGFMVEWLGMTPMQALVSATQHAAQCIGRDDVGVLEAGRLADLIIVEGDPLEDIRQLDERERIKLVMQGGRVHVNQLS